MKKPTSSKRPRLSPSKTDLPCIPLKRVNYFAGQLPSADDFRAEQDYHLAKHRRHNRLCHGSGVVQGLQVSVANDTPGPTINVEPGFALDPFGNEIQLCNPVKLRLRELRTPIYVFIRFTECPADPVPSLPGSTGGEGQGEGALRQMEVHGRENRSPPRLKTCDWIGRSVIKKSGLDNACSLSLGSSDNGYGG